TLPFLVVYLTHARSLDLATAGTIAGLPSLVPLGANAVAGTLVDRVGPRRVGVLGAALQATAALAYLAATDAPGAVLASLTAGVGASFVGVSVATALGVMVTPQQRSAAFSVMYAGINVGISIGVALAGAGLDIERA